MSGSMNISDAAKAAGVSAKMVRHYEATGLLPPAQRSSSGYRVYSERDVSVLRFIRQSRRLGFSITQIGQLLSLWSNPQRSSCEVKAKWLRRPLTQQIRRSRPPSSYPERVFSRPSAPGT